MLGSFVQRVHWSLALVAALGLVVGVSSAQAVNKNPGDPFSLGVFNSISERTVLSGYTGFAQLEVYNSAERSAAVLAASSGLDGYGVLGQGEWGVIGLGGNRSGVLGVGTLGPGVEGRSAGGPGVVGHGGGRPGVIGEHGGADGAAAGVEGDTASTADSAVGVLGQVTSTGAGSNSAGVRGINNGRGANGYGVYGSQYGRGRGVFGNSPSGFGVYGFSAGGVGVSGGSSTGTAIEASSLSGYAGFFRGDVQVNGQMTVSGSLLVHGDIAATGWKTFRIDDPRDPKHKYLVHAAIESNQVLNIYSGNITTDQHGIATVRLPAYFDRINTDLRYQLTVIGQFAQAIIAKKEAANRFVIRTDKPRVEVSWQVTARRNDAYMRAHPFHEIQNKTKADKKVTALLHEGHP